MKMLGQWVVHAVTLLNPFAVEYSIGECIESLIGMKRKLGGGFLCLIIVRKCFLCLIRAV